MSGRPTRRPSSRSCRGFAASWSVSTAAAVGQGVYYMIEMWWKKLSSPDASTWLRGASATLGQPAGGGFRRLMGGRAGALGPVQRKVRSARSWCLASWCLSFLNCLMGFVIYVQHTHPRVAWYERARRVERERGLCHHHRAYQAHAAAGWPVPLHSRARRPPREHGHTAGSPQRGSGQAHGHLGRAAEFGGLLLRYYWNTVRRCKLYDFAQHVWTDFDGRITSQPLVQTR